jgi:hypothetical protein
VQEPHRRWIFLVLAVLGLAAGVLALFGGFQAAPKGPKQLTAGTRVDQHRFGVTVLSARIGMVKGTFGADPKRSLIVVMKVVNQGRETASMSGDLVQGIAGEPQHGTYLAPDSTTGYSHGSPTTAIQPGLPIEAELNWTLPAGNTPTKVTVAFWQWTHNAGFTDQQFNWWVDKKGSPVTHEVTLAVSPS